MHKISFRDNILPLKDKLFRLALRITFDSSEAEDIVQDTLIKVWDKRDEWQQIESIESYCMTITRNLAIDRSQKMEARNMELTPEAQEMPDTLTPEKLFEQDEQLRLIHQAINSLPEKQRTIVQLRDIEGKSYKEIAEILGITEEQVKVNLFRARQRIKTEINGINDYGL
ncbi:MAG TPA: sigma-70 family RNA polymerase sigma factor [Candidatus Phocaeicola excrementigallinarum]|nr:sigma-70 family RNA polymerase sigma factor [Candidatus Phocaeicola excrementigallinarum]